MAACGSDLEVMEVRGQVTDVQATSIIEIGALTLVDDQGRVWEFTGGKAFAGFTPSHLREHALQGQPVTVRYREESGTLTIVEITD